MLGEHSVQVLREFGFSEQEIDDLLAGSVIAGMDGP
jgi:crotonobetainyl-CoA:carnitine CoA-transferase CaiB-like acyl-CoA transferase